MSYGLPGLRASKMYLVQPSVHSGTGSDISRRELHPAGRESLGSSRDVNMACRELSPRNGFDRLPPELVYALLCYVPSLVALFRLLQASRCCNDVFRSSERGRHEILQHVLHNDLEPALHSQAVAVWESTQLGSWDKNPSSIQSPRDAQQIIGRLVEKCKDSEYTVIQEAQLTPICRLHCAVEFFIRDYATTALHLFDATQSTVGRAHDRVQQHAARSRSSTHLSRLEISRLQRAFMTFELMCNIIQSIGSPNPGKALLYDRTFRYFTNAYPASEWEEVLCVIEYLHARVAEIFDELEQDYVQKVTEHWIGARQSAPWDAADDEETQTMTETAAAFLRGETCNFYGLKTTKYGLVRSCHARHTFAQQPCKPSPDAFYTRRIKRTFHQILANVLLANGLVSLKHLLQGGAKAESAVGSALEDINALPVSHIFSRCLEQHDQALVRRISPALYRANPVNPPPPPGQATLPAPRPVPQPPPPPFLQRPPQVPTGTISPDDDHDDLSRPNLGWHWSRNYLHSEITGRASDHGLRRWGYVFWDADRLRSMGVTAWVHNGTPAAVEVEKRRRNEEPSAEQVLVNMGLLTESPANLPLTTETMPPEVERRIRARRDV